MWRTHHLRYHPFISFIIFIKYLWWPSCVFFSTWCLRSNLPFFIILMPTKSPFLSLTPGTIARLLRFVGGCNAGLSWGGLCFVQISCLNLLGNAKQNDAICFGHTGVLAYSIQYIFRQKKGWRHQISLSWMELSYSFELMFFLTRFNSEPYLSDLFFKILWGILRCIPTSPAVMLPYACLDRGWTTVILQVETNGRIEPLALDDGGGWLEADWPSAVVNNHSNGTFTICRMDFPFGKKKNVDFSLVCYFTGGYNFSCYV